jgi:G patch domain-containing protein 1
VGLLYRYHTNRIQYLRSYFAPIPPPDYKPTPAFLHTNIKSSEASAISSYLIQKEKQRLDSFINKELKTKTDLSIEKKGPIPVFTVPARIATSALEGFIPFENDLSKQDRYKTFLNRVIDKDKATEEGDLEYQEPTLTEQDVLETREFAKAAMVFQPMSKMISSRFINEGKEVAETVQKVRVYGKNTRSITKWIPSKVLCRRFAVAWKQHHDEDEESEDESSKLILNKEKMEELQRERDRLIEEGGIPSLQNPPVGDQVLENEADTGQLNTTIDSDEVEVDDGPKEKPPMDLFKAIFADSDEDEDDREIEKKPVSMSWGPIKPAPAAPMILPESLDQPFRPIFSNAVKRDTKASLNKPRQKKQKTKAVISVIDDTPEDVPVTKIRPSAADYM